jgi:hypothetical protein
MIGAHNSFTYLPARNIFIEFFSFLWRCQNKSMEDLYNNYNVRFFDIRICKYRRLFKKNFIWITAHGLSTFNMKFKSLDDLFLYMKMYFPNAQYRLILERCSNKEKEEFYNQLQYWLKHNGEKLKENNYLCSWIGIKKPWKTLYVNTEIYPNNFNDYCCKIFNLNPDLSIYENIKHFKIKQTIKRWAKEHNIELSEDKINDKNTIYFMDFI